MVGSGKASAVSKMTVTDAVNFVYLVNGDEVRGSPAHKQGRGPTMCTNHIRIAKFKVYLSERDLLAPFDDSSFVLSSSFVSLFFHCNSQQLPASSVCTFHILLTQQLFYAMLSHQQHICARNPQLLQKIAVDDIANAPNGTVIGPTWYRHFTAGFQRHSLFGVQ